MSSSLRTAGPSDSDAASSSGSSYFMCKLFILDRLKCPKHSETLGNEIWANPPPVGKRTCHIKREELEEK